MLLTLSTRELRHPSGKSKNLQYLLLEVLKFGTSIRCKICLTFIFEGENIINLIVSKPGEIILGAYKFSFLQTM